MTEATSATTEQQPSVRQRPAWCDSLDPLAKPVLWRSVLDVATSVVPYLLITALMFALVDSVSYWLILALAVPASGFLLRTFIIFHDCTHGSFLAQPPGQQLARNLLRAARLLALPQLAPRPRPTPRQRRRPRPPRRG